MSELKIMISFNRWRRLVDTVLPISFWEIQSKLRSSQLKLIHKRFTRATVFSTTSSRTKVTYNLIEISSIRTVCLEAKDVYPLTEIFQIHCLDVSIMVQHCKCLDSSNNHPMPLASVKILVIGYLRFGNKIIRKKLIKKISKRLYYKCPGIIFWTTFWRRNHQNKRTGSFSSYWKFSLSKEFRSKASLKMKVYMDISLGTSSISSLWLCLRWTLFLRHLQISRLSDS